MDVDVGCEWWKFIFTVTSVGGAVNGWRIEANSKLNMKENLQIRLPSYTFCRWLTIRQIVTNKLMEEIEQIQKRRGN